VPAPDSPAEAARGFEAATQVLKDKQDFPAAMTSREHGPVTFVYGQPEVPARDYKGGYGLAHIVAKHWQDVLTRWSKPLRLAPRSRNSSSHKLTRRATERRSSEAAGSVPVAIGRLAGFSFEAGDGGARGWYNPHLCRGAFASPVDLRLSAG
jgi:hypothetical protein